MFYVQLKKTEMQHHPENANFLTKRNQVRHLLNLGRLLDGAKNFTRRLDTDNLLLVGKYRDTNET